MRSRLHRRRRNEVLELIVAGEIVGDLQRQISLELDPARNKASSARPRSLPAYNLKAVSKQRGLEALEAHDL